MCLRNLAEADIATPIIHSPGTSEFYWNAETWQWLEVVSDEQPPDGALGVAAAAERPAGGGPSVRALLATSRSPAAAAKAAEWPRGRVGSPGPQALRGEGGPGPALDGEGSMLAPRLLEEMGSVGSSRGEGGRLPCSEPGAKGSRSRGLRPC